MTTMNKSFPYQPLTGNDIRLISIEPPLSDSDPILCELIHAELNDQLEFVALSYVWGDENGPVPIQVDGSVFHVTRNLFEFLRQLCVLIMRGTFDRPSAEGQSMKFWADAICIDQMNIDERNTQVPRMGDIYSSALRVIGFLGLYEDIDEESAELFFRHASQYSSTDGQNPLTGAFKEYPLVQVLGEDLVPFTQTLKKIIQRPWFQRVWILQEAALPKLPLLCLLGGHMITAETFGKLWSTYTAVSDFGSNNWNDSVRLTMTGGPARLLLVRVTYEASLERSMRIQLSDFQSFAERLLRLIVTSAFSSSCQAKVEHDMIYGLLGMCKTPTLPEHLTPDYRRSFDEVYHAYARFIIESTRDLTLLYARRCGPHTVPTWVPDFRHISYVKEIPSTLAKVSFSADNMRMKVEGVMCGWCVTASLLPPSQTSLADEEYYKLFEDFDREILRPASSVQERDPEVLKAEWISLVAKSYMEDSTLRKFSNLARFVYDFRASRGKPLTTGLSAFDQANANHELISSLDAMLCAHLAHTSHAVTEDGSIIALKILDTNILIGDILCLLKGASSPIVLRPRGAAYEYVAQAQSTANELNEDFSERWFFSRPVESFTIV